MSTKLSENSRLILTIGPDPVHSTGGMATVVRQMLNLDFGGEFHCKLFPITTSPGREILLGRLARHARTVQGLRRAIRELRPALVHLHTCSGASFYRSMIDRIVCRRMGVPVVLHIHGAAFDEFIRKAGPVANTLIRRTLSAADRVIALSSHWRTVLQGIAPQARIVVVENAVDEHRPTHTVPRDERRPCRFLLLARMDVWKGIDDLLSAAFELHAAGVRFELVLAGPPGSAGDDGVLQRKIARLGLTDAVRYAGNVSGDRKADLLEWADAYVQPSHHEGLPLAVLEAMAAGRPVLATRVGALPEVIADGRTGLLVPPHRPGELALAMRRLVEDPRLRSTLGEAGLELARSRFSLGRFASQLASIYEGVLEPAEARSLPWGIRSARVGANRSSVPAWS